MFIVAILFRIDILFHCGGLLVPRMFLVCMRYRFDPNAGNNHIANALCQCDYCT